MSRIAVPLMILVATCTTLGCAKPEDRAVIFDRGRQLEPPVAASGSIVAIASDLAQGVKERGATLSTEEWKALRQKEVVVEVSFAETRHFSFGDDQGSVDADHLFIPLTVSLEGTREGSTMLFGRTAPFLDRLYARSGIPVVNGPDDLGREYFSIRWTPVALDRLVAAATALGVKAEAPTPAELSRKE